MKNVLLLGAGLMAKPVVDYFLEETPHTITVADIDRTRPQRLLARSARGKVLELDVNDAAQLHENIKKSDIVISLLPSGFDNQTVQQCVSLAIPLIHGNYNTEEALKLDQQARENSVLILGETGLDPGIDHMTAKKMIDQFHEQGGEVEDFYSFCGGLPAPEANTNPFGYKFSWAPKQALRVANRAAKYLMEGSEVHIEGENILKKHWPYKIDEALQFEGYANANSLPYRDKYGLKQVCNLLRGTFRYTGWCRLINTIKGLNLLDETPLPLDDQFSASQMAIMAGRLASPESLSTLLLTGNKSAYNALTWLGLLDQQAKQWQSKSAIGVLEELMLEKLTFQPGERDMSVMVHQFGVKFPAGKRFFEAVMVDYGDPEGYSSMAKTVGLTMAFAAQAILSAKIMLTGVQMPVSQEIYQVLLPQLAERGIEMKEREIDTLSF